MADLYKSDLIKEMNSQALSASFYSHATLSTWYADHTPHGLMGGLKEWSEL